MNQQVEKKSIDIGGISLYYEDSGENAGSPAIVFESGYGVTGETWNIIKNEVSTFSRMIVYDRAGLGKSGSDGRPRHSKQNVENLRALLQNAEVKPPFILIGHSFGGVNVRLYAHTYPEEIAGVILLDSCHEDQNRLMAPLLPSPMKEEYFSQFTAEATLEELDESFDQIRQKSLGNLPLTVITGGNQPHFTSETWSYWMKFQIELAQLSLNSCHVILKEAGHAVHRDCPEAVVEHIKSMVESFIVKK